MVTAVLLPGMDGTGEFLADFANELERHCKVRRVSYPEDEALGYQALAEIVRSSLPVEEPYFIVGESFSGPIALSIAAEKPKNMIGAVLCCSFARNPQPFLRGLYRLAKVYPRRLIPISLAGHFTLGRWFTPQTGALLSKIIRRIPSNVWTCRLGEIAGLDLTHIKGRILVPVLYLKATEDKLVNEKENAYIRELIPGLQEIELEGPHFLLKVRPIEAAKNIADFFNL